MQEIYNKTPLSFKIAVICSLIIDNKIILIVKLLKFKKTNQNITIFKTIKIINFVQLLKIVDNLDFHFHIKMWNWMDGWMGEKPGVWDCLAHFQQDYL
jgi:hypothetical protein